MNPRKAAAGAVVALAAMPLPMASFAECRAQSGPNTAALVELYTSEGCSSCPPADRDLARLPKIVGAGADVYALALHVDYWDGLGWKDPYAQAAFSKRHDWLVHANHHSTIYTPHFFVGGAELSHTSEALRAQVRRINAEPAMAQVQLHAAPTPNGSVLLDVAAEVPAGVDAAALHVAIAEGHLVSNVAGGENRGATLTHNHVARTWIGPIALERGEAHLHREQALPPTANPAQLEVVAFVEDEHTGRILQTLGASSCAQPDTTASSATALGGNKTPNERH